MLNLRKRFFSFSFTKNPNFVNKIFALFCLFSLSSFPLFSQKDKPRAEDIAFAEAMKTEYEDASVAALASRTEVRFDFDSKTKNVEVFTETSEVLISLKPNYEHLSVDFFSENSKITKAEVTHANGRKMPVAREEEMYSSDDIFYSDAQISYFKTKFPTIGTRRTIVIEKKYSDIRYFVSEYLTRLYPVENRIVRFRVPDWLEADFRKMNFVNVTETVEKDPKNGDTIYTFEAQHLPPEVQESYAKGRSYLYPHLLFLYRGYDYKGQKSEGFRAAKDLYGWYRSLINGMQNEPTEVAAVAAKLTADATTDAEKIKAVYYWVQDNIRYIAFEDGIAGFRPDNCQAVYQKKYGDCKGMANLTKEMLNSVGLDARLVWIGTRRLAYDYSTPSLGVDNHMICAVKQDDDFVFLDATEEFNELGFYAERIQGREVLIENGDTFISKKIPRQTYADNTTYLRQNLQIDGEQLTGTSALKLQGESKAFFLSGVNNLRRNNLNDAMNAYLSNSDKSCKVSDIETSDLTDRDGNIDIDYNFAWSKGVSAFGDEMYVDLDFEKEFKDWTFDERKTDYLFNFKSHRVTEITLTLPEGYTVGSLPENFAAQHDNFFFKIDYTHTGNTVVYRKEIGIPNAEISTADFAAWNTATNGLRKQYKEQIVLKKQ